MEHEHSIVVAPGRGLLRIARLGALLAGPVVTLELLHRYVGGIETASLETLAVLLWSPLFFSVPALLLQNERDAALPSERNSLVRGVKLLPYLLGRNSPIRLETIVSTGMWLGLLIATRDSVAAVLSRTVTALVG